MSQSKLGTVRFKEWDCRVEIQTYPTTNRTALLLKDVKDSSPIAVATVNLPDQPLPDDELFIKNWSENEGIYEALVKAGYIKTFHNVVATGYVTALQVKMTPALLELLNQQPTTSF